MTSLTRTSDRDIKKQIARASQDNRFAYDDALRYIGIWLWRISCIVA